MITNAIFNISTDIMIIALPMPVLINSQLPLKRKLTLCGVFALGIFTILAAILSKYYSLGIPYGTEWIYWYIREVSTAIIAANLPLTWTLLQRMFGMSSFLSRNKSSLQQYGKTTGQGGIRSAYGNLTSRTQNTQDGKPKDPYAVDISPSESTEQINGDFGTQLKIWQRQEIQVVSEEVDPNSRSSLSDKSDKSAHMDAFDDTARSNNRLQTPRNAEMGFSTKVSHAM